MPFLWLISALQANSEMYVFLIYHLLFEDIVSIGPLDRGITRGRKGVTKPNALHYGAPSHCGRHRKVPNNVTSSGVTNVGQWGEQPPRQGKCKIWALFADIFYLVFFWFLVGCYFFYVFWGVYLFC